MYCKYCGKRISDNERYEHLELDEFEVPVPMIVCEHCYDELLELRYPDDEEYEFDELEEEKRTALYDKVYEVIILNDKGEIC